MFDDNMVLRGVYLDQDVYDALREDAKLGTIEATLLRRYLAAGMKAAKARPRLLHAARVYFRVGVGFAELKGDGT